MRKVVLAAAIAAIWAFTSAGSASAQALVGDQNMGNYADSNSAGVAQAFYYTASNSGNASDIDLYVNSGSTATAVVAGLYSDASGKPGTRLASGSLASPKAQTWNDIKFSSTTAVTQGTKYWIAILGTGGTLTYLDTTGSGTPSYVNSTKHLTSLPQTYSSGAQYDVSPASAYVNGATATQTVLLGDQSSAPSADSNSAGVAQAFAYQATASGTTSDIEFYVNSGTTASKLLLGIYADANGKPGSLLTSGSVASPKAQAWNDVGVGSVTVTAGNTYWIALLGTGGQIDYQDTWGGSGSSYVEATTGLATLPATYASGNEYNASPASAYVLGLASGPPPPPPSNTTAPAVTGQTIQGQTLSTTNGSWTSSPTSFAYRWEDCNSSGGSCSSISGATSPSYTLTGGDVGHAIRSVVSASNAGGSGSGTSAPTAVVTASAPAAPANTSAPVVSGQTGQGDTLTTSNGSWSNGPTSFAYRWEDCNSSGGSCSSISGATSSSYTLGSSDVGHTIVAVVTATNAGGSGSASSAATGVVTSSGSGGGGGGGGQANCMSQLQSGSIYPAWQSVAACGYPTPTSLDPNGLASGGTAGVPDGTVLQNAKTCGCLPAGDSWSGGGYVYVDSTATLSDLYIPGGIAIANSSVGPLTIQDVDVEGAPGGDGYLVNGQSDSGVTIKNSWIHSTYSGKTCTQTTAYSTQNYGVGHFGNVTLQNDDVDCFGIPVIGSNLTISGSVIISEGMSSPSHNEAIYSGAGDNITGNTIINPEPQTADFFGDQNCGGCGTLSNITLANNLVAGNQNNGAFAIGCTATGSYQMDFGHGPNVNIVVQNNRFSNVYNVNPPGGGFSPGSTDGQSGTTWSGNYMDNNLSAVAQPVRGC